MQTLILTAALITACAAPSAHATRFAVQSLKEIREHAVVMQRWETSCAAASVATVLSYAYADPVSERNVAGAMLAHTPAARVRARGGFSLLDMKRFVEGRGYAGAAYRHLSLDELKFFRAPIVPLRIHGRNHYVVVNAVGADAVRIADPAFGNRVLPVARFEKFWRDGLAFVIHPAGDAR